MSSVDVEYNVQYFIGACARHTERPCCTATVSAADNSGRSGGGSVSDRSPQGSDLFQLLAPVSRSLGLNQVNIYIFSPYLLLTLTNFILE